jgi:hypothetical protein
MANEIRALAGDGGESYPLLLLFPIAAPKQYNDATGTARNVVPTPTSALPTDVTNGVFLTAAERAQLDAGTLAFRITQFSRTADMNTAAKLTARVQAIYAEELKAFTAWYTSAYRYIGSTASAP